MREKKMCRKLFGLSCALVVLSTYACSVDDGTTYIQVTCNAGDTQVCICDDGKIGTKTCVDSKDGSSDYGECNCSQAVDPGKNDSCKGITCDHGACVTAADNTAVCVCYGNYLSDRDSAGKPVCVESNEPVVTDNCEGIDCAGHGACVSTASGAVCICENGYQQSINATTHQPTCEKSTVAPSSKCDGIDCTANGQCMEIDGSAICNCKDGYSASLDDNGSPTCVEGEPTSGPCVDVGCSEHGKCVVTSDSSAYCLCDIGYSQGANATTCEVDENVSPCQDVTCNNAGTCMVSGNDQAFCLCNSGYHQGTDGKTCEPDAINESPCKGVTCANHGACVVTADNTPYCLCNAGYHQSSDNTTCEADVAAPNPCNGQTCSEHGVCIVTSNNSAYCICETGYETVAYTSCVKSNVSISGNHAYPTEATDPWGLVWDSQQRAADTWENAKTACASIGGRLPNSTEITRNSVALGEASIGDTTNTDAIWASDIYNANPTTVILGNSAANKAVSNLARTTKAPYRCVWDADTRPITLSGVNCHSSSAQANQCIQLKIGNINYNFDRADRGPLTWSAAAQQCREMGGRLPTIMEAIMAIRAGLPDGKGVNLWTSQLGNSGDSANFVKLYKWTGTLNKTTAPAVTNLFTHAGYSGQQYFRCVSEDVELDGRTPVFPQTKAATAKVVTPLLRIDATERTAKNYWDAAYDCMEDGGHIASADELLAAIRAGLVLTNKSVYFTRTPYNAYQITITGTTATGDDFSYTHSNAAVNTSHPYFCAYRPNRAFDSVKGDLDEQAAVNTAFKYEQTFGSNKITYYTRDISHTVSSNKNVFIDAETAAERGMYIPEIDELNFMIRHGLTFGAGKSITLITSTTATLGPAFRATYWEGTQTETFVPVISNVAWNATTINYRSYISSTIQ